MFNHIERYKLHIFKLNTLLLMSVRYTIYVEKIILSVFSNGNFWTSSPRIGNAI
ncbi:MAG: hypothetical protein RL308_2974 [Bacteroidota bacterium]|jgi:hypothetical protein